MIYFTGHEKESDLAEGIYTTEYCLYDARVGRWLSIDPLFEKYVGMSPYNYCMLNPVMMVDPDGRKTYIGVETKGTEHTFIVVSNESCYSVYTYGRYGKADAITLGTIGEGVLIKYQGNDAREYILTELYRMEANIYQINDANDDLVKKYFDSKFDDISTK
jgi:RHS repeat-associated protein